MNIDLTHPEILTIEQLQKHLIKVIEKKAMLFSKNEIILIFILVCWI